MPRPTNNELRSALLGALDKKLLNTLSDINDHLKEVGMYKSYASTRRMLLKMEAEGLVVRHPQRLEKNAVMYTKGMVSPHLVLRNTNGDNVTLSQFIADVYEVEFPGIIDPGAANAIKLWMFDYIVASDPSRFNGVRDVPNRTQLKRKLEGTLPMLQQMHAFIKHFLDSDLHSPVAETKIARELNECPDKQVEFLVTRRWMDNEPPNKQEENSAA